MRIKEEPPEFFLLDDEDDSCITATHSVGTSRQAIVAAARAEVIISAQSKSFEPVWQILKQQIGKEEKYAVPNNNRYEN